MDKIPHRLQGIDYYSRRIYHITMTTEGRRPLLGTAVGNPDLPRENPGGPHVVPSALGREVLGCLTSIEHYYPQARLLAWQLMPDHLHVVIFITQDGGPHLGQIVKGFKLGCNRAYRRLTAPAAPSTTAPAAPVAAPIAAPIPAPPVQEAAIISQPHQPQPHQPQPHQLPRPRPTTQERKHGQLWSASYYETPLYGQGQLHHMIAYVHDNPRRLLLKRQNTALFAPYPLEAAGMAFTAIGDAAILSPHLRPPQQQSLPLPPRPRPQQPPSPARAAVQLSTHLYLPDIDRAVASFLQKAKAGTLLISPFISLAEKSVMEAIIAARLPYVRLDGNGFGPYYKPAGRDCDLVAEGRLLLLAPWEPRPHLHRADFMALNAMAARLAAEPAET